MTLYCRIIGDHDDLSRDFHVVGPAPDLRALINTHAAAGTLVYAAAPQPATGSNAYTRLRVRDSVITGGAPRPLPHGYHLAERPPTVRPNQRLSPRRPRRRRIAVIVTTITGTIAGIVAVAAYLIGQLVELIAAHAALILSVLALALAAILAARRPGRRRHCPGC